MTSNHPRDLTVTSRSLERPSGLRYAISPPPRISPWRRAWNYATEQDHERDMLSWLNSNPGATTLAQVAILAVLALAAIAGVLAWWSVTR
jgi:hypothetical protein